MMTEQKEGRECFFCPFCDVKIAEANYPLCQVCGVTIFHCPNCHKPVSRGNRVCPHCGAVIYAEKT